MADLHEKLGLCDHAVAAHVHRLRWHGHAEHDEEKEILNVRSKTIRHLLRMGHPKKPWGECISQDL